MLHLGEPDFDDVDQAARLWLRYEREGGLSPDDAHVFWMMCGDKRAVRQRVEELRSESPSAA